MAAIGTADSGFTVLPFETRAISGKLVSGMVTSSETHNHQIARSYRVAASIAAFRMDVKLILLDGSDVPCGFDREVRERKALGD
jgi:hypothetical protein